MDGVSMCVCVVCSLSRACQATNTLYKAILRLPVVVIQLPRIKHITDGINVMYYG